VDGHAYAWLGHSETSGIVPARLQLDTTMPPSATTTRSCCAAPRPAGRAAVPTGSFRAAAEPAKLAASDAGRPSSWPCHPLFHVYFPSRFFPSTSTSEIQRGAPPMGSWRRRWQYRRWPPSPARVFPLGGGPMSALLALSDHCSPKAAPAAVVAR
jgi:hypothetical protein